jgi:UDP-2,3-diacylglucosamine hydrolase
VNADAVIAALNTHHADVLLHGHTHRPAVHHVDLGNREALRYVLGDWHPHKAWYVRSNAQGLHLEAFAP